MGYQQGLSGLSASSSDLDVIGNNIANANTVGFKSGAAQFADMYANSVATAVGNQVGIGTKLSEVQQQFSQGTITSTNQALDVAINGNGYLVVQTAGGDRYTRNGSLQINGQGQLVTGDGAPVIGDNGPIVFQPTDHDVMISPDGRVTVTEAGATNTESLRGQIRIVSFAAPQQLQKEGNNLYVAPAGVAATPDTSSKLIQGSIEKSNVNGVVAISRLIEISRAYAQVAQLLSNQSDLHKNAISQLANVPT